VFFFLLFKGVNTIILIFWIFFLLDWEKEDWIIKNRERRTSIVRVSVKINMW